MPVHLITLQDDDAQVQIAPAWGAALTRYDVRRGPNAAMRPVLRPWDGRTDGGSHPFALACNVLLPWSNRIGADGFSFEGVFYPVEANVAGERYPLHGNGFQSAWEVVRQDQHSAQLCLLSKACKPFDYEAQLHYRLDHGALTIGLSVIHKGNKPLPYGIGLHPWLARAVDSVLSFDATHYWSQTLDHLPLARIANAPGDSMDFSAPRPLPDTWLNAAFEGWGGSATLASTESNFCIDMRASGSFSNLQIFSPSGDAGFVCVEPVSHIPNAHGLAGLNESTALNRLEFGQKLEGWLRICCG